MRCRSAVPVGEGSLGPDPAQRSTTCWKAGSVGLPPTAPHARRAGRFVGGFRLHPGTPGAWSGRSSSTPAMLAFCCQDPGGDPDHRGPPRPSQCPASGARSNSLARIRLALLVVEEGIEASPPRSAPRGREGSSWSRSKVRSKAASTQVVVTPRPPRGLRPLGDDSGPRPAGRWLRLRIRSVLRVRPPWLRCYFPLAVGRCCTLHPLGVGREGSQQMPGTSRISAGAGRLRAQPHRGPALGQSAHGGAGLAVRAVDRSPVPAPDRGPGRDPGPPRPGRAAAGRPGRLGPGLRRESRRAVPSGAPRYAEALAALADQLYPCFCTRREIAEAASAPNGTIGRYPGTCRELTPAERAERGRHRSPALRLRANGVRQTIRDVRYGEVSGPVDDIVVQRNDGCAAYNLAVVVDDAASGVDQVVRGDDPAASGDQPGLPGHSARRPDPHLRSTSRWPSTVPASGWPSGMGPSPWRSRPRGVSATDVVRP
jgi:hypothetical protein